MGVIDKVAGKILEDIEPGEFNKNLLDVRNELRKLNRNIKELNSTIRKLIKDLRR